jgi:hypothetical protein
MHWTPFGAHLCKKGFWKSDGFLMVDFLYLIPPNAINCLVLVLHCFSNAHLNNTDALQMVICAVFGNAHQ